MYKIKVLHLELGKNFYGGAKQVFYLIKGLCEKGIENVLVSVRHSEISKALSPFDVKIYRLPYMGDLDVSFLLRFIVLLKKEKPHIVHVHSRKGADVWGGLGAFLCRIPCLLTRRVDNPEPKAFARLKYSLYKKVVVISLGIKKVLLMQGIDEKKIVLIPSGIEFESYNRSCNRKWFLEEFSLKEHHIPLGMIAQFIPRKGHITLIKAVLKVIKGEPHARFILFGKGPLEDRIKKMVHDFGLDGIVRFAGFRDDLERILPCLFAVVHPATMEGLGVSLLQASAAGVPIIATPVGGIPEVVMDGVNGFLVPPENPEELSHRLLFLLRNREKAKEMGLKGKELVKEKFSVENMVDSYIQLYTEMSLFEKS